MLLVDLDPFADCPTPRECRLAAVRAIDRAFAALETGDGTVSPVQRYDLACAIKSLDDEDYAHACLCAESALAERESGAGTARRFETAASRFTLAALRTHYRVVLATLGAMARRP